MVIEMGFEFCDGIHGYLVTGDGLKQAVYSEP